MHMSSFYSSIQVAVDIPEIEPLGGEDVLQEIEERPSNIIGEQWIPGWAGHDHRPEGEEGCDDLQELIVTGLIQIVLKEELEEVFQVAGQAQTLLH